MIQMISLKKPRGRKQIMRKTREKGIEAKVKFIVNKHIKEPWYFLRS